MNKGHPELQSEINQFKVRSLIDKDTNQVKYIIKVLTADGPFGQFGIHSELIQL